MSLFVDNILELIKDRGITKSKFLSDLGLNRNSLIDWNKRGTIPNADTVSAIADYLEVPIGYLLGLSDNEEKLSAFNEKLALQMAYKGISMSALSEKLGVSVDVVYSWLKGEAECPEYYDRLAEIFEVAPTYWVRPGMVSPGIEPTLDEYLLIILFREYRQTGELKEDLYGYLRDYFPTAFAEGSSPLVGIDPELLQMIRRLNKEEQIELRGYIRGVYGRSVAADPSEAPSGKMAK
ncbi:MAG: helix-turn-helix domain-containing protein [Lachnospiraceae bacterium]|nr:helix-turn-helix domain-containing protein [Lachnospiraceae bacterium]